MDRNCEFCGYCTKERGEMICANIESEYYMDYVDTGHGCSEWEEMEDEDS